MEYFKDCMTHEALEKAHRDWVKKLHPDLHPDNPNATAEFQEMQAQYEERKAELNGDYSKARKGRERRERENRERQERERREQARRRVEQVVEQARLNRQKHHTDLKAGDYIYARGVKFTRSMFAWEYLDMDDLLHVVCKQGVKDETVVKIETVIQMDDESIFTCAFSEAIPDGGPWGGREILQEADPKAGVYRQKGVAKVIMFRSPSYCVFGNPNGDPTISDYYLPEGYAVMFGSQLDAITARLRHEQEEAERKERERKARLLAEQQPLIDEWRDRLIGLSACLTLKEREQVAIDNLKTVLRAKFPGTTFRIKTNRYGETSIGWEDGPTERDVMQAADLFNGWLKPVEHTPWMQQFGRLEISAGDLDRKMNVLTKARILQQLGQVTEAFREGGIDDEVTVTDFDWLMLHLLAGISVDASDDLCMSTLKADGTRAVNILAAVRFIFRHTAYTKTAKPKKSAKKAA